MPEMKTLVDYFESALKNHQNLVAYRYRDKSGEFREMTFAEADQISAQLAAGLTTLGVSTGTHVGLIADVSHLWNLADLAVQRLGAIDVPRGTDSTADELGYILSHSGSEIVIVHNAAQVAKINTGAKKFKHKVKRFIILNDEKVKDSNALTLSEVLAAGSKLLSNKKTADVVRKNGSKAKEGQLATIVYTSGTTGEPKGVMLTHANFASQLKILPGVLLIRPGNKGMTLLPPWHIFGRIAEYMFFCNGVSITYTDVKNIGDDLRNVKPHYVPAVPRIWEGVYNKILAKVKKDGKEKIFIFFRDISIAYSHNLGRVTGKERRFVKRNPVTGLWVRFTSLLRVILLLPLKKLGDVLVFGKVVAATGGNLMASLSGGGALPSYVDDFFAAIGIRILEGYGLTETSPVLSVRIPDRVIPGTVGPLIEGTEYKLIDADGKDVTRVPNAKGTLHVRGPQIMKGYYKNPKKTKEVLTEDGWFNTGDLIKINVSGELSIVGRSKDTIVLVGGENVEPTPIEDKLKESPYIDQVMCVGQDKKTIGALIVPNSEELLAFAKAHNIPGKTITELAGHKDIQALFKTEIQRLVSAETGFKSFERVTDFRLLNKPFEVGVELTNKMSVKRNVVMDIYHDLIEEMYK